MVRLATPMGGVIAAETARLGDDDPCLEALSRALQLELLRSPEGLSWIAIRMPKLITDRGVVAPRRLRKLAQSNRWGSVGRLGSLTLTQG